jgi:hypothetical protein
MKDVEKIRGTNKDTKNKPPLHFLPRDGLVATAQAMEFGAKKYDAWSYRKGIPFCDLIGGALRHINAWKEREDLDDESGLSHLAHAAFNILALLHYEADPDLYSGFDNRPLSRLDQLKVIEEKEKEKKELDACQKVINEELSCKQKYQP